jgi:hypothetical protein
MMMCSCCVEHSHLEIQKEREETLGRGNGRHAIPRGNKRFERLLVCPLVCTSSDHQMHKPPLTGGLLATL